MDKDGLSELLIFLLKNYKKSQVSYSDKGRMLKINNIEIRKVFVTSRGGEKLKDRYLVESNDGKTVKYNCFDICDNHVYIDGKVSCYDGKTYRVGTDANAWRKLLLLDKLCHRKCRLDQLRTQGINMITSVSNTVTRPMDQLRRLFNKCIKDYQK